MTNVKSKPRSNPTDFTAVQEKLQASVVRLLTLDRTEAVAAHHELAMRLYKYARVIRKRDATEDLRTFLLRQTRSVAVMNMDLFELCVFLPLTHEFPPLSVGQRRSLALKLAYADHTSVEPGDLDARLAQFPPARVMKLQLGKIVSLRDAVSNHSATLSTEPTPSTIKKRLGHPKRKPRRLAGSRSHKLMKAGAKAAKRRTSEASSNAED